MVTMIDMGMATIEISVVRRFIRKKNSTIMTNSAPSSRVCCRLLMELSMKSLCRNMSSDITMSGGRVRLISSSLLSMASVRPMVPVSGCFVIVISTAGCPLTDAAPIRGCCPPISTSAMSASVTIPRLSERTTAAAISSGLSVLMTPFIIYSLP